LAPFLSDARVIKFVVPLGVTMNFQRRQFLRIAAGTASLAVSPVARAQAYPTRTVTIVVPLAPGGAVDATGRIVAAKLQAKLEQPVVVENRAGAGSVIGTSFVAKSTPDGHTLLLMEPGAVIAKWVNKSVSFDVTADFAPIAQVATSPLVLFAHPSVEFGTIQELVSYCKDRPGKLSVGTVGVGSPHHMAAAWLNTAARTQITLVPYRGAALALNDLLGGQIPLMWATPVAVLPFLEQGKVKALAVSTPARSRMLPQVPTMAESIVPGFDITAWLGVVAPARVSMGIVSRLAGTVREITEHDDVRERLSTLGLDVEFRNSERFRELIASDYAKYRTIARDAGIQPA
jgi:tripartite-type tricarboxylate transporter receptor subunit TctC